MLADKDRSDLAWSSLVGTSAASSKNRLDALADSPFSKLMRAINSFDFPIPETSYIYELWGDPDLPLENSMSRFSRGDFVR